METRPVKCKNCQKPMATHRYNMFICEECGLMAETFDQWDVDTVWYEKVKDGLGEEIKLSVSPLVADRRTIEQAGEYHEQAMEAGNISALMVSFYILWNTLAKRYRIFKKGD